MKHFTEGMIECIDSRLTQCSPGPRNTALCMVISGTLVLWMMLRQGAPITPHLTAALGALGAAGLGNFCVRLGHPEDVTVMLLVWHAGGVLLLAALASLAGRRFLNWRSITASAGTTDR